ncbi:transcriptional regulator [Pseudomonas sp. FW305-3-2-15-E-TSA4]|nr:transcriptional regulator [Pseudomonas sp. FW305-3-2-15-E-TSA4]
MRPDGQNTPTAAQVAAARAATGLSVAALAERSGLGVNTIRRAEASGASVLTGVNAARLVQTFEELGVVFLDADGYGPGLRIRS